MIYPEQLPPAK